MGTTTQHRWLMQAIAVIVLAAGFFFTAAASAPNAYAQDDDGPDAEFDSRVVALEASYIVIPDQETIAVTETITIRNVRGSTTSGNIRTDYFWTGHTVWIAPDAENISITSNGGDLTFEQVDEVEDLVKVYSVDFPSNLFFGQTRVLEISYTLPSYTDDGPRRVNGAFFDFNLITCCNFEEITIEVVAPRDFIVSEPDGGGFTESTSGSTQVYTYYDSEVSGDFTDFIISDWFGINFDGYEQATVPLGGEEANLEGYPDDPDWLATMTQLVRTVSGAMQELTGNGWTQAQPEFQQVSLGALSSIDDNGVEEWLPNDSLVLVPSPIPTEAVALSIARQYVDDSNFDFDWMTEATVLDMTSESLGRLVGPARSEPNPPSGQINNADEGFWFVRQITDEIGYDGLLELERLASTAETSFVGSGAPELSVTIDNDWRRLLDLGERRMGMTSLGALLESNVLSDSQVAELTTRTAAIARYDELRARVGIDEGPIGLRNALTNWQFDDVNDMIDAANLSLDDAEAVSAEAASAGLRFEPDMLAGWTEHASVEDFASLTDGFDDRRAAMDDIAAAEARLDEERGYVDSLGYDEEAATSAIADARSAFDGDDLDGVDDSLASFATIEADASSAGQSKLITRFIVPIAVAVLLLIGGLLFWRRRRKKAASAEVATPTGVGGATAVAAPAHGVIDLTTAPPPPTGAVPSATASPVVSADAPSPPPGNAASATTVVPASELVDAPPPPAADVASATTVAPVAEFADAPPPPASAGSVPADAPPPPASAGSVPADAPPPPASASSSTADDSGVPADAPPPPSDTPSVETASGSAVGDGDSWYADDVDLTVPRDPSPAADSSSSAAADDVIEF